MDKYPPLTPSPVSEPPENYDSTMDCRPAPPSTFNQGQLDRAIQASLDQVNRDEAMLVADLRETKRLHDADLYKTQENRQDGTNNDANVLVLVKFPDSRSNVSCRFTTFTTGRIRLTYGQVLATGSGLLAGLLTNERHQLRAKKAAAPLPTGVDYVLDLSPTTDENDYTIALQLLSTTHAIQLWHRSVAIGTSPLAVAGHDDVCICLLPFNEPYPLPTPPESIKAKNGILCVRDTVEWPEDQNNIVDFCTTRWAANTLRLFRAISMPPGLKDLLIDSAPRMWTLVGLFAKLEMTNYDILRDDVVAWFNADMNHAFVELCPEETLYVGLILKTPLLTEPAFRILVNERALEVAGGQPRLQPATTLFGRPCSDFTGTDVAESISRMIEHASNAMAERYKIALDNLCGDNALDLLDIPKWQELRALGDTVPTGTGASSTPHVRVLYDCMMSLIRLTFRDAVDQVIRCGSADLPSEFTDTIFNKHFRQNSLTTEQIDEKRAFSVPKKELATNHSFVSVYASLNPHQRALIPMIWHGLCGMAEDSSSFTYTKALSNTMTEFAMEYEETQHIDNRPGSSFLNVHWMKQPTACYKLFASIKAKLRAYVTPLVTREDRSFSYTMTPHLLLVLNDHEMNFLRLADDESTFQSEAPETDLGPSGPGPVFHTGLSVPSVSDMDFEKLALESNDGSSTIVGSMAVQDGFSTVYGRGRVLARSDAPSVASEQFTDSAMSADYADAQYEVPADHQSHGQTLAQIVEQADDEYDVEDLELDLDESSDSGTAMDEDDAEEAESDRADHALNDADLDSGITHSSPLAKELEVKATWSEEFDSDFQLITKDETA